MSKVKMPEPVAFRWKAPIVDSDGRQCGESEWKIGMEKGGLPWWTQDNLITTDQAEAYADARVREELEATGGHRLVEPDHETAMALADAPRSLRNYVAALRSAIALQSQDADRLDWLQQSDGRFFKLLHITSIVGRGFSPTNSNGKWFPSLRDAIDHARSVEGEGNKC